MNASLLAVADEAAAAIAMLAEVAPVSPPSLAASAYVPLVLRARLLNVATPFTAATDVVLPPANPPGPLPTFNVTVELLPVATFPNWSCTTTLTDGLKACPAVPVDGT